VGVALAAIAALAPAASAYFNHDIINEVNKQAGSWVAGEDDFMRELSADETKGLMGTRIGKRPEGYPVVEYPPEVIAAVPTSFDSRQEWPQCATISTIYNQARCGSCWAFGCVETVQDRFCIHSSPNVNVSLSFMDLVTCDNTNDGCNGGDPFTAMECEENWSC